MQLKLLVGNGLRLFHILLLNSAVKEDQVKTSVKKTETDLIKRFLSLNVWCSLNSLFNMKKQ